MKQKFERSYILRDRKIGGYVTVPSLCVNIDLCIQSEVARNEIGKGKSMTNFVGTFC